MAWLQKFIDVIFHVDQYLIILFQQYGFWVYGILFLIVFLETGLVVTPFLPGDSLLFTVGAFASTGALNITLLFFLLTLAAILGDTLNYWIGYRVGPTFFHQKHIRYFNKEHLEKAHTFYEKYGGKTIILARFIPIIRTFAPFVAGIARMTYGRFVLFNIVGAVLWVGLLLFAGYFFGTLPFVQKNLSIVIIGIIILSFVPLLIEYVKHRLKK